MASVFKNIVRTVAKAGKEVTPIGQLWFRNLAPVVDGKAIANDPRMGVMIAHGWDDLSCPFFASRMIVAQMPAFGQAERVKMAVYPGGHMFYSRPDSGAAFKRDAKALFHVN